MNTRDFSVALAGVTMALGLAGGVAVFSTGGAGAQDVVPVETVRETLTEMGYEVLSLSRDGAEYEGYALRDGKRWEVEVDAATGRVLEIEYEADESGHDREYGDRDDLDRDDLDRDGGDRDDGDRDDHRGEKGTSE
jgi:hypothetical protein